MLYCQPSLCVRKSSKAFRWKDCSSTKNCKGIPLCTWNLCSTHSSWSHSSQSNQSGFFLLPLHQTYSRLKSCCKVGQDTSRNNLTKWVILFAKYLFPELRMNNRLLNRLVISKEETISRWVRLITIAYQCLESLREVSYSQQIENTNYDEFVNCNQIEEKMSY